MYLIMAELKKVLQDKISNHEHLDRICLEGLSSDELKRKHFKIQTKLIESGNPYDTHECIITLVTDKEIFPIVSRRQLILLMRSLEEPYNDDPLYPHIFKTLDQSIFLNYDKDQMSITFHVINNVERQED